MSNENQGGRAAFALAFAVTTTLVINGVVTKQEIVNNLNLLDSYRVLPERLRADLEALLGALPGP